MRVPQAQESGLRLVGPACTQCPVADPGDSLHPCGRCLAMASTTTTKTASLQGVSWSGAMGMCVTVCLSSNYRRILKCRNVLLGLYLSQQ